MKRILLTLTLVAVLTSVALAQQTIKGSVRDEQGGPLVGATIVIKGTSSYAVSDVDGQFTLASNKSLPLSLQVNSVGYQGQEVEIFEIDGEPLEISLKTDNLLDEIVVVGYGEQKRKDITGSISSVPTELKAQPVASVERLLQGAV